MSSVNLYDILDVDSDCSKKDLIRAYRKLVKQYHPDKPSGDEELFELINHAFEVLSNDSTRSDYDELYRMSQRSGKGHSSLKEEFNSYTIDQKPINPEEIPEETKLEFKKINEEMDKKYNTDGLDSNPITVNETGELLDDIELLREQEDIENTHNRLFESSSEFNLAKFNEAFMMMNDSSELVKHNGDPSAIDPNDNFSFFDRDYGNMCAPDDNIGSLYTPINNNVSNQVDIDSSFVSKLQEDHDTHNHNKLDEDYTKNLDELIKERDDESNIISVMDKDEFKDDMGNYGIFDKLGIDPTNEIEWNNEEEFEKCYKKLLEHRQEKS